MNRSRIVRSQYHKYGHEFRRHPTLYGPSEPGQAHVLCTSSDRQATLQLELTEATFTIYALCLYQSFSNLKQVIGKTSQVTCPVDAMKKYSGTIPKSCKGPQFVYASGKRLTRKHLTRELRYLLSHLKLNSSNYAGHSFCIGAATSAAALGLPSWLIKTLGRWTSDLFETYISIPISVLCQATQKLGSTCTKTHGVTAQQN